MLSNSLAHGGASVGAGLRGAVARRGMSSGIPTDVDVAIVGGGITGSALLYSLAQFTDLKKVLLMERRSEFARVASGPNNNSQTIHCGDIETNYTVQKAAIVKRQANMLRNFLTGLPPAEQAKSCARMQKMAIGVGANECSFIEKRFENFKELFPSMELIDKKRIAEVEPAVAYTNLSTKQFRAEPVVANYIGGEHAAVDYFHTTNNFVKIAEQVGRDENRFLRAALNTEMEDIRRGPDGRYEIQTNRGLVKAKFVVVSSCGYSLLTAHRMGYGKHLSCMPVAGSFYFGPAILKGKVYCVQNPLLPFAAVHGDPDLVAGMKTRFGPTALPLPLLERYEWRTFPDFLRTLRPDLRLAKVYWDLFKNNTIRNYLLTNCLYEVPKLNVRLFLRSINKIVPSLRADQLTYAHGFGGVRPQVVDKNQKKLLLGEGKIDPQDAPIVFNITPSPGGTTCLGTAEADMRKIVKWTGCAFNKDKFQRTLLNGLYATTC